MASARRPGSRPTQGRGRNAPRRSRPAAQAGRPSAKPRTGAGPASRRSTTGSGSRADESRNRAAADGGGSSATGGADNRDSRGSGRSPLRASLTGRAATLALVLGLLAVSYAYPLRAWYDQSRERSALQAETERLTDSVDELERELELWDDPEYVRARARERLGYVMPGEVGYIVVDEAGAEVPEIGPDGLPVEVGAEWHTRLWNSVLAADAVPDDADDE